MYVCVEGVGLGRCHVKLTGHKKHPFHQEPLPAAQKRLEPKESPWERRGPELGGLGA